MAINGRDESCERCDTPPKGEHFIDCPEYEPPLTSDELKFLRQLMVQHVVDDVTKQICANLGL